MCEPITHDPRLDPQDLRERPRRRRARAPQRDIALRQACANDADPGKKNALSFWRDSVLSRLQPPRDTVGRMPYQIVRLPKCFLPHVTTAEQRVLFGPNNEAYLLKSYTSRTKYEKGDLLIPAP